MIHERSLEAYRIIKENGLLKKLNWEVYDFLFHHGPRTTRDITVHLRIRDNGTTSGCITRLKDKGVIAEVGTKTCETTGMNVSLWNVTAKIPEKEKKKEKFTCPYCKGKGYSESHEFSAGHKFTPPERTWKESLFD